MTWILPRQLHTSACALDTEALSLDCTEQSQICAQSLFVRSKPSQLRIWSAKWKRDSWTQHLSGRILRPSLGQRFATEWTSSLVATHASPSVQPVSAKGSKTRGIYGRGLQMAFDFSDPAAASLKTSKDISRWGCPTLSKTWQEWVTERRGAYSARRNAARLILGSGSGFWPTPTANEDKDQNASFATLARLDKGGRILRRIATLAMRGNGLVGQSNLNDGGNRRERLNPAWVESLLGLPSSWTDCASSETESFQQPPHSPSEPCSEK